MTALRLLAPVLSAANVHLLKEACFKSKLEVKELIAKHFPSPDVADTIRRLPQPRPMPTAQELQPAVLSHATPVDPLQAAAQLANLQQPHSAQASGAPLLAPVPSPIAQNKPGVTAPLSEGRYKVTFTASQSLHDMLNEARDLCCDGVPNGELAAIVEQALVLLIAHKKKQRFALTSRPRTQWLPRSGARSTREASKRHAQPREEQLSAKRDDSKSHSRYIPSALRREVYIRDGGQCCFVSPSGTRCGTRRDLEFHHADPFARGGEMTLENLSLVCRAHNALFAERDFGRDFVKSRVAKRQAEAGSRRTIDVGRTRSGPGETVDRSADASTSTRLGKAQ